MTQVTPVDQEICGIMDITDEIQALGWTIREISDCADGIYSFRAFVQRGNEAAVCAGQDRILIWRALLSRVKRS